MSRVAISGSRPALTEHEKTILWHLRQDTQEAYIICHLGDKEAGTYRAATCSCDHAHHLYPKEESV